MSKISVLTVWLKKVLVILLMCSTAVSGYGNKKKSGAGVPRVELVNRLHIWGVPVVYKCPRPAPGEMHVALGTSLFLQLIVRGSSKEDRVDPDSVVITLTPGDNKKIYILKEGSCFAPGFKGSLVPNLAVNDKNTPALIVYIAHEQDFRPAVRYGVQVTARSKNGAELAPGKGSWSFTTEDPGKIQPVKFSLDLRSEPVRWNGAFFQGFCQPSFCTAYYYNRIDGYRLMHEVHKRYPRAWGLQRDYWLTGDVNVQRDWVHCLPGLVREQETRRITSIEEQKHNMLLHLEDFYGHQQYGIESDRLLSPDYHPGDVVLIADGRNYSTAEVRAVNNKDRTVLVSLFNTPEGGWKIGYTSRLPEENSDKPGLFPPGGCYLRKFRPPGTPRYYWGRVDKEWDLARKLDKKLVVNFGVPADLSVSGRYHDTAKNYVQYHEAVRTITDRLIRRYGDACLDFFWSLFNEPDLKNVFWQSTWEELQKCYDYAVDGILRAFEDNGYDSSRVLVGGLELASIAGKNLKDREFLAHCSPRAEAKGALPLNSAYTDRRLDGRRSRRVEELCREHGGKGTPFDFISIHCYNTSKMMAEKLVKAKKDALEIDPDYYSKLRVCSYECCPGWQPSRGDPAWYDSYRGNGYFITWAADVVRRLIRKAKEDPRYAYGETVFTVWPWPDGNMMGLNACTSLLSVDIDGDGKPDKKVTVKKQIFNFIELLASMGDSYFIFPEKNNSGYAVSGFAARTEEDIRILLYTHRETDTESGSDAVFDMNIRLTGLSGDRVMLRQYRMDKYNNSCFRMVTEKLGKNVPGGVLTEFLKKQPFFTPLEVDRIKKASLLHETAPAEERISKEGELELQVKVSGNGLNFLVLEPAGERQ